MWTAQRRHGTQVPDIGVQPLRLTDCVTLGKLHKAYKWKTSWPQNQGKAGTPGGDGAESEASWRPWQIRVSAAVGISVDNWKTGLAS